MAPQAPWEAGCQLQLLLCLPWSQISHLLGDYPKHWVLWGTQGHAGDPKPTRSTTWHQQLHPRPHASHSCSPALQLQTTAGVSRPQEEPPVNTATSSAGHVAELESARPVADLNAVRQRQGVIKAPLFWQPGWPSHAGWMLLSRASREGSPPHEIYSEAADQLPAASDLEGSGIEGCRASCSLFPAGGARTRRLSDKPQGGGCQ